MSAPRQRLEPAATWTLAVLLLASAATAVAAAPPQSPTPKRQSRELRLTVRLEPQSGRLRGSGTLRLDDVPSLLSADGRLPIELHSALTIESVRGAGGDIGFEPLADAEPGDAALEPHGDEVPAQATTVWALDLAPGTARADIEIVYSGLLRQDVEAGEEPGEIHNRSVDAHIGSEGIYLSPDSAWHPRLAFESIENWIGPDPPLMIFDLTIDVPLAVVASGNRIDSGTDSRRWRTPFPLPGLALAGGPLEASERRHGEVTLKTLLASDDLEFSDGLLDAAAAYLDLYEPLIGPYPFEEFTIIDNFFSSGFAFPGFTLLSSAVIQMGDRSLRPGYLDHEMLHNWWGNGVLSSRRGGHWSEALATYCANYMRPILEGRPEEARSQRRDIADGLSRNPKKGRQVVADFGRTEMVGTYIGYQKGSLALAQIAAEIGQSTMWRGLARFAGERLGKPSTWDDLRDALETESGHDLTDSFSYWIGGEGLPSIDFGSAHYNDASQAVELRISQPHPLELILPLRLRFADRVADHRVRLRSNIEDVRLPATSRPLAVEVDPDFETLRLLPPELAMPTITSLSPPLPLKIILYRDDQQLYGAIAEVLEERFEANAVKHRRRPRDRDLRRGHLLLLGRAARTPTVEALLAGRDVHLAEGSFRVGSRSFDRPRQSLLACLRNPGNPGAVICVYSSNGEEGLVASHLLPFYGGNSLLVFEDGMPVHRLDFEAIQSLPVD